MISHFNNIYIHSWICNSFSVSHAYNISPFFFFFPTSLFLSSNYVLGM